MGLVTEKEIRQRILSALNGEDSILEYFDLSFDESIRLITEAINYHRLNGLSSQLIDHLYSPAIPLNYQNQPYTALEFLRQYADNNAQQWIDDLDISGCESTDIIKLLGKVFKGVNKSEMLPYVFESTRKHIIEHHSLEKSFLEYTETRNNVILMGGEPNNLPLIWDIYGKIDAFVADDDEICPFNVKNLIKFHKKTKQEAQALYRCVIACANRSRLKMFKNPRYYPVINNLCTISITDDLHCSWSHKLIDENNFYKPNSTINKSLYPLLLEELERPLPSNSYNFWLKATIQWYSDQLSLPIPFNQLSLACKHRHIVNFIRHNSFGYCQMWRLVNQDVQNEFHRKAKHTTLSKIMATFPLLATECLRQLNDRTLT